MCALKIEDQGINLLSQEEYLTIVIESFLIDCRSQGLSSETIDFYAKKLKYFITYGCNSETVSKDVRK